MNLSSPPWLIVILSTHFFDSTKFRWSRQSRVLQTSFIYGDPLSHYQTYVKHNFNEGTRRGIYDPNQNIFLYYRATILKNISVV